MKSDNQNKKERLVKKSTNDKEATSFDKLLASKKVVQRNSSTIQFSSDLFQLPKVPLEQKGSSATPDKKASPQKDTPTAQTITTVKQPAIEAIIPSISSTINGGSTAQHVTDTPYVEDPISEGKNLIPRSQEVHEILSYVPNWMVRWGNTVILPVSYTHLTLPTILLV